MSIRNTAIRIASHSIMFAAMFSIAGCMKTEQPNPAPAPHSLYQADTTVPAPINYDSVVDVARRSIHNRPADAQAYFALGDALRRQNKPDSAILCFQKANTLDPSRDLYLIALGLTYEKLNKPAQALAYYRKAVQLHPQEYSTYYKIGYAFQSLNQDDSAVVWFKRGESIRMRH